MIDKKEKLKKEIQNILDTGKSKIIKKYNLSYYDILRVIEIIDYENVAFLQGNIATLLKDYGYKVEEYNVGYRVIK